MSNQPASNSLSIIADQLQYWLDCNERGHKADGTTVTPDMHVIPPTWPSRGVLRNWIAALRGAAHEPRTDELAKARKGEAQSDRIALHWQTIAHEAIRLLQEWGTTYGDPRFPPSPPYGDRIREFLERVCNGGTAQPPSVAPQCQGDYMRGIDRYRCTKPQGHHDECGATPPPDDGKWPCCCVDVVGQLNVLDCQCCGNERRCRDEYCRTHTRAAQPPGADDADTNRKLQVLQLLDRARQELIHTCDTSSECLACDIDITLQPPASRPTKRDV
jgi:hypothetical protein